MPEPFYNPSAATAIVGVSISTLRGWCSTFAPFLSSAANPGPGQERRLSPRDVAIFQRVKDLRSQGLTTAAIMESLAAGDETGQDDHPFVDVQPTIPTPSAPTEQPTTPTTQPLQPSLPIEIYTAIISHQTAITARLDGLQAQVDGQKRERRSTVTVWAFGFLAGLLVAAILIGAAWLMK